MQNENKYTKKQYNIYMNFRVNKEEADMLKNVMKVLCTYNRSEALRYLINNNIVAGKEEEFN